MRVRVVESSELEQLLHWHRESEGSCKWCGPATHYPCMIVRLIITIQQGDIRGQES